MNQKWSKVLWVAYTKWGQIHHFGTHYVDLSHCIQLSTVGRDNIHMYVKSYTVDELRSLGPLCGCKLGLLWFRMATYIRKFTILHQHLERNKLWSTHFICICIKPRVWRGMGGLASGHLIKQVVYTKSIFWLIWPSGQLNICNQAVALSSLYSDSWNIINGRNFICAMYIGIPLPIKCMSIIWAVGY